jgi:hypothetical protein
MEYLKIRNWDKWQSYRKDRGQPPWIKLHRRLMRNPEWVSLSDAERGQLVCIWLIGADHDGVIPASSGCLQKLLYLSRPPNLNKFISLGFLENGASSLDANMTPTRQPSVTPKAETETEADKNPPIAPPKGGDVFESFWKIYPRKIGKGAALRAWSKLKEPKSTLALISDSLEWQIKSEQWTRDGGQFIPHPATYLNQRRWEDEPHGKPGNDSGDDNLFLRSLREEAGRKPGQ